MKVADLPVPESGREGWPWTAGSDPLPPVMPDGRSWPRITIVTPSYNQAEFVEETIRSILLQNYPNLEYVLIDGGSTDGSVEIIRRYEPWLSHWVSEPDRGQTHAINKGLDRATGDIFAYLNSDDLYTPGALRQVAEAFAADPDAAVVFGDCRYVDEKGEEIFVRTTGSVDFASYLRIWKRLIAEDFLTQPEVFCRTSAVREVGGFREDLHSVMDFEMWIRMLRAGHRFRHVDRVLAEFRSYGAQKSGVDPGDELAGVVDAYLQDPGSPLSDEQRQDYAGELRKARADWLVRGAIAAADVGYHRAASLCWRAARTYPPIAARYEMWAVLSRPLRDLVPSRWREVLRKQVHRRRAAQSP